MKLRAPAVPLITVDPYFSVWSRDTLLNAAPTMHWTGANNTIIGVVVVDGKTYSFLGYERNLHKLNQVSLDISALSTVAVFDNDEITLNATFTTPVLPDSYEHLTRPVSYLELSYTSKDGKAHDVMAHVRLTEELCLNHAGQNPVETAEVHLNGIHGMRMGNTEQKPLNRSGDDLRIDWGYVYLTAVGDGVVTDLSKLPQPICPINMRNQTFISVSANMTEGRSSLILFAYDDVESIEYFHKPLRSYWNRDGKSIETAIQEAADEYTTLKATCDEFSASLFADAKTAGGEQYAEMLALTYRQVIAAHKLVLDEDGEVLWISKECFSNGCAATVDVSYPSIPMFLLYNPELVKGMMRPVYRYADSDEWKVEMKYDFAPHDVGRYPILNGQVYGKAYDAKAREFIGEPRMKYQMPVEECGNMLIMETNVALATGSADFAAKHLDVLVGWSEYLIKYGADPADQLCTDDFAGHLAHNCNLSLKAIMGIQGMSMLMGMLGRDEDAAKYRGIAEEMTATWMATARNADGSTNLAFDQPNTFSMKYNMVWDKVWGTGLFTQVFRDEELRNNRKHFNRYGLPLDNRSDYTKSDWWVWVASMASKKADFATFVRPLWQAFNDSASRVPMTDWFDTVTAREVTFQHRSVQGGLFMQVLMNKWTRKKKC